MKIEANNLSPIEFAQARKDMAKGILTEHQWEKADTEQRKILHQIELTIHSLTEEDLIEIL